jgi:hypothetical protein
MVPSSAKVTGIPSAYETSFSDSLPEASAAISNTPERFECDQKENQPFVFAPAIFRPRNDRPPASWTAALFAKSAGRQLRREIEQFLQALIESVELVFAQLVGGLQPQLIAHECQ